MIQVKIGTNAQRKTVILDENTTLKRALEDNEVDYSVGNVHLDGSALNPGELNKTFAELGVVESCFLLCVVKVDNN